MTNVYVYVCVIYCPAVFQSKAMRERWLLQGTQDGEDSQRRQVEQDELHVKQLEDAVHRYVYRLFTTRVEKFTLQT